MPKNKKNHKNKNNNRAAEEINEIQPAAYVIEENVQQLKNNILSKENILNIYFAIIKSKALEAIKLMHKGVPTNLYSTGAIIDFLSGENMNNSPHVVKLKTKANSQSIEFFKNSEVQGDVDYHGTFNRLDSSLDSSYCSMMAGLVKVCFENENREALLSNAINYLKAGTDNIFNVKLLYMVNRAFRNKDSNSIEDIITKKISSSKDIENPLCVDMHNEIVLDNIRDGNYQYALKVAKENYDFCKKILNRQNVGNAITEIKLYSIVYNLALCHSKLHNVNLAIKYYTEAREVAKNAADRNDAIESIIISYITIQDFDKALTEAKNFSDEKTKCLYAYSIVLQYNASDFVITELLRYSDMNITIEEIGRLTDLRKKVHLELLLHSAEYDKFFSYYEYVLNKDVAFTTKEFSLVNFLQLCLKEKFISTTLLKCFKVYNDFYGKNTTLKNHDNLSLNYLECKLFCNAGDEEKFFSSVKKLKNHSKISNYPSFLKDCEEAYIAKKICDKNYDAALDYSQSSDCALNDTEKKSYLVLIQKLIKQAENDNPNKLHSDSALDGSNSNLVKLQDKQEEKAAEELIIEDVGKKDSSLSIIDLIDLEFSSADGDFSSFTAQEIHCYFQHKKQKSIDVTSIDRGVSWQIDKSISYHSKSDNVYPLNDKGNFYAIMEPKLIESIEATTLNQFKNALKNGFVSSSKGQNGVKIIQNKVIELKISEDLRLYTTELFQNSDGKYLIIFNNQGNHEKVSNVVNQTKSLTTTKVDNFAPLPFKDIQSNNNTKYQETEATNSKAACDEDSDNNLCDEDLLDTVVIGDAAE